MLGKLVPTVSGASWATVSVMPALFLAPCEGGVPKDALPTILSRNPNLPAQGFAAGVLARSLRNFC